MMQIAMESVQINRLARMTLRTMRIATMFVVMWTRVLTIMTMTATVTMTAILIVPVTAVVPVIVVVP